MKPAGTKHVTATVQFRKAVGTQELLWLSTIISEVTGLPMAEPELMLIQDRRYAVVPMKDDAWFAHQQKRKGKA